MRYVLIALAGVACCVAAAQTPPTMPIPPAGLSAQAMRIGYLREIVGAAPACGLRSEAWAERLRDRAADAFAALRLDAASRSQTESWASRMESYGRLRGRDNLDGYCAFVGVLADEDALVEGRR